MIFLKSLEEIDKIRRSSQIVAEVLKKIKKQVKPGVCTLYLNSVAENIIKERGAVPGFLHYRGFPFVICASKNSTVVHGFPDEIPLKSGDLLSVDVGAKLDDYYGDASITIPIGKVSPSDKKLIKTTEECLYLGIEQAVPNNRLGDISYAIQKHAEKHGYGLVRNFGGHGIGKHLHEEPHISNVGNRGEGILLKAGMVIAIEPMLTAGTYKVYLGSDGWSVITEDGKNAAHFEHTIAITENGPKILSVV